MPCSGECLVSCQLSRVFDEDHSGSMDFGEYALAINATGLSSPEEKLKWVFNVFDEDGGGTIDSGEIHSMMVGLFGMSGTRVSDEQLQVNDWETDFLCHHPKCYCDVPMVRRPVRK